MLFILRIFMMLKVKASRCLIQLFRICNKENKTWQFYNTSFKNMRLFCIKLYSVGCVAKFGAVLFKFLQRRYQRWSLVFHKWRLISKCFDLDRSQFQQINNIRHWSQTQFVEGHSSAQFSSNPNQTHLIQIIKVFRITRNFQAGVCWSWLELISAELWSSRNWVWDQWYKGNTLI